ncbi:MAG: glucan biosynthesis protein, partial [Propionivibrio sp.]
PGFIPKLEGKPDPNTNGRIMLHVDFAPPPGDVVETSGKEKTSAGSQQPDGKQQAGHSETPPPAAAVSASAEPPEPAIDATTEFDKNAELIQSRVERNEVSGGWRLTVVFRRLDQAKPVEMRAVLTRDKQPVSETWTYILPPD